MENGIIPLEVWTVSALPVTENELAVLLELQSRANLPNQANVLRLALHHLTKFYGMRVPADVWALR